MIPNYKPYQYKKAKIKKAAPPVRAEPMPDGEVLSGTVDDGSGPKPASDLEERFAIALRASSVVDGFEYRQAYIAERNLPGEKELDFAVYAFGVLFPIQIDGEFAHKTSEAKAEDELSDMMIDEALQGTGAYPTRRISGALLETIDDAKRIVKEYIG
jgi:hypothetical protein